MSSKLFSLTVIIFLAISFIMFLFLDSLHGNLNEATGLVVSAESFPNYIKTHPIMASLPSSAAIGIKIGDDLYEIEGDGIKSVSTLSNEDVVVNLPAGYEKIIGEIGLCSAAKKAKEENNLGIEVYISRLKLLLKYGRLLKYGDCLK